MVLSLCRSTGTAWRNLKYSLTCVVVRSSTHSQRYINTQSQETCGQKSWWDGRRKEEKSAWVSRCVRGLCDVMLATHERTYYDNVNIYSHGELLAAHLLSFLHACDSLLNFVFGHQLNDFPERFKIKNWKKKLIMHVSQKTDSKNLHPSPGFFSEQFMKEANKKSRKRRVMTKNTTEENKLGGKVTDKEKMQTTVGDKKTIMERLFKMMI